jgi:redox-sensing transcriptional repressor
MKEEKISEAVIRRLPKYYRYLNDLEQKGIERISSWKMSSDMNLNASQIRRDLNCFGGFGQQGYGYQVSKLRDEIKKILGLGKKYSVVILGAGNIGQALIKYLGFEKEGYSINALFDVSKNLIGKEVHGTKIYALESLQEYLKNNKVDIGFITTPKESAQKAADLLMQCGVKAIWNFAPVDVQVKEGVKIENVHLSDSLYVLCYRMSDMERKRNG